MKEIVFSFESADGKTTIYAHEYHPDYDRGMKGIIQIEHGLSENTRIYLDTVAAFVKRGYIVRIYDHIGHGSSVAEGQKRNYFGEKGSWSLVLEDMRHVRMQPVPEEYENLPYILLGHSLGAFLVREYLIRYGDVDGAVISGSGTQPIAALKIVRFILKIDARRNGYDSDSDLVQNIMHGTNNKKLKEKQDSYAWLVKDPKGRELFENASDVGGRVTAGIFLELSAAMLFSQKHKNIKKMKKDMPLLVLAGGQDASVDYGKSVKNLVRSYRKCGLEHVKSILYHSSRHCIYQDYAKKKAVQDIDHWITKEISHDVDFSNLHSYD